MKRINQSFDSSLYLFDGITGTLLKRNHGDREDITSSRLTGNAQSALQNVNHPYLLEVREQSKLPEKISVFVRLYAKVLTRLCRHSFILARMWARIPLRCYPDAGVATIVYRKLYPGEQQRNLCLPRAFFARSASKRFPKQGTMFIGVFFPSVQMHSWVIEDDMHADVYDNNWINFTPIALFN